jgi:hypothetical protein
LGGIRVLKQNCWEEATVAKITALRDIELGRLKQQERIVALIRFSFFTMPVLVAVVTFGTHALMVRRQGNLRCVFPLSLGC